MTSVAFRLATTPRIDEVTKEVVRAGIVAWGIQAETGVFMPERFSMPYFVDSTLDVLFDGPPLPELVLQWTVHTQVFDRACVDALVDWIRRALAAEYPPVDLPQLEVVLWIGV